MVMFPALVLLCASVGSGDAVLLQFSSDSCQPCRAMQPIVQRLAQGGLPVRQIKIDQQPQLASQYRVHGVPCFIMVADGKIVDRVDGMTSYARLERMFRTAREHLAAQPRPAAPTVVRPNTAPVPATNTAPAATQFVSAGPADMNLQRLATSSPTVRSLQASVRLVVEEPNGKSLGTGTIIDRHGDEALIVSCAHIFRGSAGKGRILVDLFCPGAQPSVEGQLITYDFERDIALIAVRPGCNVVPVPVAPAGFTLEPGRRVFSVGCDRGRPPSVRNSHVTDLNRYVGPDNVEVAGAPVDGRSGGGLFSEDGMLVGICNFADNTDNEGIYAALSIVHWQLDQIGQQRIYQHGNTQLASAAPAAETAPVAPPTASLQQNVSDNPALALAAAAAGTGDTEVICIVRSRSQPQGNNQVIVVAQPSSQFLDLLARESRQQPTTTTLSQMSNDIRPVAARATAPMPTVGASSFGSGM